MAGRLQDKVVLISGTGGGQGRAAAQLFAAEGATIVGGDLKVDGARETVRLVEEAGGAMTSMEPVDFGDPAAVDAWVAEAAERHGRIDVLYNNASIATFAPLEDTTEEQWRSSVRNELDIVFYACRAAWPHLKAAGSASIVNIASMQGISAVRFAPGGFAHAAMKHGIIGLTRELALEGGPFGIRVNAISPGLIQTPATQPMADVPGLFDAFLDHQIVKRLGQATDVAAAALFFASDQASFITGENLVVDGGYSIV